VDGLLRAHRRTHPASPRAGRHRHAWAATLVALAVVLGAGCGGQGPGSVTADRAAVLREAAAALCTAKRQAAGDPAAARRSFYDRAHDRLHELARLAERTDRAAAARLLEAKQRVEHDLDGPSPPARLAGDLDRLLATTNAALAASSISPPTCTG
jgi:cytosine/adenosine deaminase-related metal-dependent hydrolase